MMAQTATSNGVTNVAAEEATKPPAGVVLPPKDIRAIVEKTAGYVARNGPIFEDRIRQKNLQDPKFSFLDSRDAYYPFYEWRLDEIKEGRGSAVAAGRAGDEAAPKQEEKVKGPEPPPEFQFSARMPNISAQDLDVVRLSALFAAKHGRAFQMSLSQREAGNFQFDFLRPQHSLYQFFSRLVDQYSVLLNAGLDGAKAEKARIKELEGNVTNRFHMLDRARKRAEWVKFQEQQKQQKEEQEEAERLAYGQIDWHDFVVVETVLFNDADEQTDLPPPTSLNSLQSASLEQKAMHSLRPNMRIEEAMPTSEDPYYLAQQQQQQQQQQGLISGALPIAPYGATPAAGAVDDEEEQRIRERSEARERAQQAQAAAKAATGPIRIRNDYVPRAQAKRQNVAMAICPNCKQQIPYDDLEQHMRIELLDPGWKEQKAKADSRYATTNLSTSEVANNLKRLASQRTDVFDAVTGEPISEEEAARRKRTATGYENNMPVPDVKPVSMAPQPHSTNIEEQIRQIHQKFKQ